jgi:hypothetical protein
MSALAVTAALIALLHGDAGAREAPPESCAALPQAHLRVRLNLRSQIVGGSEATIRRIVDDTWAPVGVTLEWVEAEAAAASEPDLWINAVHLPAGTIKPGGLGVVTAKSGVPQPLIYLSIDAILEWVIHAETERLGISTRFVEPTLGRARELTVLALGYAAAHEIGHFLLGSGRHANSGLMRDSFNGAAKLLDPDAMRLDARSARRISERLRAGEECRNAAATLARR